jgi:hypothetical protein
MKLLLGAAMLVAVMAVPGLSQAQGFGLGIKGSPHDFTDNVISEDKVTTGFIENSDANPAAWNNRRKEICRVCHIPHDHGEVRYGNQGLLWNHRLSTKTTWAMYASDPSMINFIDGVIEPAPTGVSALCMACHDGVSAINYYDGRTAANAGYGNGTEYFMSSYETGFAIGNTPADQTNNHPISITYDHAMDPELFDPATRFWVDGQPVTRTLVNGRVECSTCHDVHDRESIGGTHLLRARTKGDDLTGAGASEMCLTCHDK